MDEKYTILGFDRFLDELLDKMGSDYFPLPVKFNRFITIALDFLAETAIYDEATQEVSDFIKPLRVEKMAPLSPASDHTKRMICPEPINYFRLISLIPLYSPSKEEFITKARQVNVIQSGNALANNSNPFKKPTEEYPEVQRMGSLFYVNVGNEADLNKYKFCRLVYIKKPTFGNIENDDDRIINLPDDSIEKIYLKTADSFRFTTSEPTAGHNYEFTQTFGKKNR